MNPTAPYANDLTEAPINMASRSPQNHQQNKKQPIKNQLSTEDEKASLNVVKEEKLSCIALESFNPTNTQKTVFFSSSSFFLIMELIMYNKIIMNIEEKEFVTF